MSDDLHVYELTVIARDARNRTGEAHREYKTRAADPYAAAQEAAIELQKALGKDHVVPAGPDKGDG